METKTYPNKNELVQSFSSHKTYTGYEVVDRINSTVLGKCSPPTEIKKYDVVVLYSGKKKRPCVVIKVIKDIVITIPLTSSENHHSSVQYKCRFFGEGYLCKTYEIITIDIAKENFVGVFEDKKAVREVIKEIKIFTNKF